MTKTSQTFGHCRQESDDERCEYLTLAFSPLSAPLRSRWRNNGLSADFLGDYVTTFLPANGDASGGENRQVQIRHAVAYIANELLENAMKYHDRRVDIPIGIHLELAGDHITVAASNGVDAGQAHHYQQFVENMVQEDAGDLLVQQLEHGSQAEGESTKSCLGLLTMINDYGAKLGWRFEADDSLAGTTTVTTSALLDLDNLLGVSA
jgi:hypothetical protein